MATATGRNCCVACGKEKATFKCGGCLRESYFNHLGQHKQELSKQLDEVEVNRDLFRQTLTKQTAQSQKHPLIQLTDQWERDSIKKVGQTAEEKLTKQLRQNREENDFLSRIKPAWFDR